MDIQELNSWIQTEAGTAWLNEQKAGLLSKRDELLTSVRELTAKVTESTQRADDAEALLSQEREAVRVLAVDNELDALLTHHKVMDRYRPAVKSLLRAENDITVKADGQRRTAMVGDRPLKDFMDEWAESEAAKNYIAAPVNTGGGAMGSGRIGTPAYSRETISRMTPQEVAAKLDTPEFQEALKKL